MLSRDKELQMARQATQVANQLSEIIVEMQYAETKFASLINQLDDNFKLSGINLIHYLVLRSAEIRETLEYLHHMGLSSLTNSESHSMKQLLSVLSWIDHSNKLNVHPPCDFEIAEQLCLHHAEELLGIFPGQDRPHIMVTFSEEMMSNKMLIEEMLNEGMTVARINCAHDHPEAWLKMIQTLKKAILKTGRSCKIYMDLAGPKIRIKEIRTSKNNVCAELPVTVDMELLLLAPATALRASNSGRNKLLNRLIIEPSEILPMTKKNEHVYFDDGKFAAVVVEINANYLKVKITRISTKNPVLKPAKGINLPDSDISIPPLTKEDKLLLPFICKHADLVGYSFVSQPEDIELLRSEINIYSGKTRPSIILKIERLAAIQNLPALLLNGMKDKSLGVMIARGDLAVEIGFERLSEIQEEILWLCEAAHVPVIWATQVLETLNKTGFATRSEITDAAMSVKSECVMLNKGKYIIQTIRMLDDILLRQSAHVNKKRYIMRPLGIAKSFIQSEL